MQESHFVFIFESVASEVMGSKAIIGRKVNLFYQLNAKPKVRTGCKHHSACAGSVGFPN